MIGYKLVPVEITDEMAEASGCEGHFRKSAYDQAQDMWSAMLTAAPDVQGEASSRVVPSRDDLIQCLLATHGQSEGITADAILSMLAAAPTVQEEPVGWHPIETAPHGEEVLLGWLEWDGAWKMEVSQASWGWSTKTASNISRHGQATHWMPLPDVPQSSEPLSSNPRPLSSKSSEPVGEVRFELGTPSVVYAELYGENLPSLAPGTKLYAAPPPAEQQPDVAQLVEALEDISGTHHHSTSAGEYFAKVARKALAAHRKQQEASSDE